MHRKLLREMSRTGGGHAARLVAEPGGVARLWLHLARQPAPVPLPGAGSFSPASTRRGEPNQMIQEAQLPLHRVTS